MWGCQRRIWSLISVLIGDTTITLWPSSWVNCNYIYFHIVKLLVDLYRQYADFKLYLKHSVFGSFLILPRLRNYDLPDLPQMVGVHIWHSFHILLGGHKRRLCYQPVSQLPLAVWALPPCPPFLSFPCTILDLHYPFWLYLFSTAYRMNDKAGEPVCFIYIPDGTTSCSASSMNMPKRWLDQEHEPDHVFEHAHEKRP